MEEFVFGAKADIDRLKLIANEGGQHLCKLNRMPHGYITSLDNSGICDIDQQIASTVTARYYKGVGTHKENMVIEIWKINK